jgi:ABC-type hemin transport system ATPase subunit
MDGNRTFAPAGDNYSFALNTLFGQVRQQARQRSFGWRTLDRLEIGFNPGDLSIVAARTGHGKSTVLRFTSMPPQGSQMVQSLAWERKSGLARTR